MNPFGKYPGFLLNGIFYSKEELTKDKFSFSRLSEIEKAALNFARLLFDDSITIEVQTSGSTGKPKKLNVLKSAIETSAKATNSFFGLTEKSTAALALSLEYIAGKMMVARAIVGQFQLLVYPPQSLAIPDQPVDFMPLVPLQIETILREKPEMVGNVKCYLIGGGKVESALHEKILNAGIDAWYSFGMTETLSHFALAKAENGTSPVYRTLPGVEIKVDKNGKLEINWLGVTYGWLHTNDLVELTSNGFRWLGRADNLINSGGVKIIPEVVESILSGIIQSPFFIAGVPNALLGEEVVLYVKGDEIVDLKKIVWDNPYWKPRKVVRIAEFEWTISGKIRRKNTVEKWLKKQE